MADPYQVSETLADGETALPVSVGGDNYSSTLEHLGGPLIKLTKTGYQHLEDAQAEQALFEKMYTQLEERNIPTPFYLCVDCTELDGFSRAARKSMMKESKETAAYFGAIACYGLGRYISTAVHLFKLLRWQIGIHLFHSEEECLAFLLEQQATTAQGDTSSGSGIYDQREDTETQAVKARDPLSPQPSGPTLTGDAIRFLNQHLPQAETVRIGGFEQRVMQPPDWIYASPDNKFRVQAVLIGDDTILATYRGNLQERDIRALQGLWNNIFGSLPGVHFHLIYDCLALLSISAEARHELVQWDVRPNANVPFCALVGSETAEPLVSWAKETTSGIPSRPPFSSIDLALEELRLFRRTRFKTSRQAHRPSDASQLTTIQLSGDIVEVFAPERWRLSTEDGSTSTKYSLLGPNTILAECFGVRTAEHTRAIIDLLDQIVLELGGGRLHIIQVDRDISHVESEVRRLRIGHFRATKDTWLSVCHMGTPATRTLLTLLEPIISTIGPSVHAVGSIGEAWAKGRELDATLATPKGEPKENRFDSLDRAGLLRLIRKQEEELEDYKSGARLVLEGLTRITFGDAEGSQPDHLLDPDGPFASVFSALHLLEQDFQEIMAERDRRENEIAMAQIEAETANKMKTEFLATMSHELRTPLTAIFGLIERLRRENLDSEQLRAVDSIERAATGLLHQVSDVLDFATIGAGKLSLNPKPCDLRTLIQATLELHAKGASEKGLRVCLTGEERLPPLLLVDPGRFQQVLDNLISNAIKFTATGGVDIHVECEKPDGQSSMLRLRVVVSDTGPGISAPEARSIFSRFERGEASQGGVLPGVGLGLAIANNLIRHMGGMIGVETSDRPGATFWFELFLPILDLDEATASADSSPSISPVDMSVLLKDAHVLVVEDNDDLRELTSGSLRDAGCTTLLARNGSEALTMLMGNPVDLVLMDCKMPVMDGYEATEELRRLEEPHGSTPVIALTAYALGEERERCFASGMDDYLTKPFSRAQLLEVVARNLRHGLR